MALCAWSGSSRRPAMKIRPLWWRIWLPILAFTLWKLLIGIAAQSSPGVEPSRATDLPSNLCEFQSLTAQVVDRLCPPVAGGGDGGLGRLGRVGSGDAFAWSASIRALAACETGLDLDAQQDTPVIASGTFLISSVELARSLMAEFSNATRLRYNLTQMLPEHYIRNQFRIASTLPTANESGPYDFWMVSAEAFGMPELNDAFLDTSLLLSNDHDFQWTDIPRFFRFAMSGAALGSYNSIPAALAMTFLYYQPRLFERYNISIPHTWEDVIEVAEKYNGQDLNQDGRGMIGICMDVSQSCGNYGNAVLNILATMIQTRGPTDGVVLDPDTLELLAAGEPLQEALRLFSRLQAVSIPADTPCFGFYTQLHAKGRCLMTIGMPSAFKVASHERFPGPMHGNLGVLLMPGSSRVLDRSSGRLVPCTLELCPYATHVVRPSRPGEEVLVNKVNAFDTASMAINRYKPLHRQAAALRMLSFTFGPIGSKAFALAPTSEAGVLRYSQLDLDDWLAAGYERSNTEAYLAETIKMFDFPNTFIELRFPGTFEVHDQLKELTRSVVWGNASIKAAEDKWVASVRAIVEARGGVRGLGPAYRRSLGIMTISSKFLQMFMEAAANKDSNHDVGEVVAAVVVPVVVVLLLALMAALLYVRRSRRRQQEKQDSTSAPGPGCVVLCVTDIENSTTLWETLPADVCQSAIQLHHSTIRRAADTFKGYESATEGDSFILAFASANDCVRFCLHVQEALGSPETPWPAELLASPLAGVVTLQPPQPSLEQQQSIRAMCGPGILTSLLRHVAPGSDGAGSMAVVLGAGTGGSTGFNTQASMRRMTEAVGGTLPYARSGSLRRRLSFAGAGLARKLGVALEWDAFEPPAAARAAAEWGGSAAAPEAAAGDTAAGGSSEAITFQCFADGGRSSVSQSLSQQLQLESTWAYGGSCEANDAAAVGASPKCPAGSRGPRHGAGVSTIVAACRLSLNRLVQKPHIANGRHGMEGVGADITSSQAAAGQAQLGCGTSPFASGGAGLLEVGNGSAATRWQVPHKSCDETASACHAASAPTAVNATAAAALDTDVAPDGDEQPSMSLALETRGCPWDLQGLDRGALSAAAMSGPPAAETAAVATRLAGDSQQTGVPLALGALLRDILGVAEALTKASDPTPGTDNGDRGTPASTTQQTAADDQQQVADRLCVFRGLRVRIGFHGGYFTESEVSFNRASQRTVYSGAMARAAKAIGDVGRGGQVMASAHTLATVRPSLLRSDTLLVLHAGRHVIKEDDVADTELYCLYSRALAARAAVVDPPRSHLIKVPGSLAAPLGRLAVALLQVGDDVTYGGLEVAVWLFSLRAWAQERAAGLGGYLLLTGPGTFQAVFTNPLASVEWMLDVQDLVLDRGAGGGTPAADGRASRLSGNSSGGRPSLGPSKKQDQGDTPGNVDMQLSARGGADVGCLQASLTSDGWVTYSGGACKRVACMTARAAWGCALVSVELARQVLGPGDPQLETIEEACIAAGVGDAGGGEVNASRTSARTPLAPSSPRHVSQPLLAPASMSAGLLGSSSRRRSSAFTDWLPSMGMVALEKAPLQRCSTSSTNQPWLAAPAQISPSADQGGHALKSRRRRSSITAWFHAAGLETYPVPAAAGAAASPWAVTSPPCGRSAESTHGPAEDKATSSPYALGPLPADLVTASGPSLTRVGSYEALPEQPTGGPVVQRTGMDRASPSETQHAQHASASADDKPCRKDRWHGGRLHNHGSHDGQAGTPRRSEAGSLGQTSRTGPGAPSLEQDSPLEASPHQPVEPANTAAELISALRRLLTEDGLCDVGVAAGGVESAAAAAAAADPAAAHSAAQSPRSSASPAASSRLQQPLVLPIRLMPAAGSAPQALLQPHIDGRASEAGHPATAHGGRQGGDGWGCEPAVGSAGLSGILTSPSSSSRLSMQLNPELGQRRTAEGVRGMSPLARVTSDGASAAEGTVKISLPDDAAGGRVSADGRLHGRRGGAAPSFYPDRSTQSNTPAALTALERRRGLTPPPRLQLPEAMQRTHSLQLQCAAAATAATAAIAAACDPAVSGGGHGGSYARGLGRSGSGLLLRPISRAASGNPPGWGSSPCAAASMESRFGGAAVAAAAAGAALGSMSSFATSSSFLHVESGGHSCSQLADLPENEPLVCVPDRSPGSALLSPFPSMQLGLPVLPRRCSNLGAPPPAGSSPRARGRSFSGSRSAATTGDPPISPAGLAAVPGVGGAGSFRNGSSSAIASSARISCSAAGGAAAAAVLTARGLDSGRPAGSSNEVVHGGRLLVDTGGAALQGHFSGSTATAVSFTGAHTPSHARSSGPVNSGVISGWSGDCSPRGNPPAGQGEAAFVSTANAHTAGQQPSQMWAVGAQQQGDQQELPLLAASSPPAPLLNARVAPTESMRASHPEEGEQADNVSCGDMEVEEPRLSAMLQVGPDAAGDICGRRTDGAMASPATAQQNLSPSCQLQPLPGRRRPSGAAGMRRSDREMPVFTFAGVIKVRGNRIPVCWVSFAEMAGTDEQQ